MAMNITVNGTIIPCVNDLICPYSSICYYFDRANPTLGQCGCNIESGEIGLHCDEPGRMSIYRYITVAIAMIASIVVFFLSVKEAYILYTQSNVRKLEVKMTTLVECALCELFLFLYSLFGLLNLIYPNAPPIFDLAIGKKKRYYTPPRNAFLAAFVFFNIAAMLNISVLWLEVAIASKKFRRFNNNQISGKYQKFIFAIDVIAAIIIGVINWFSTSLTPLIVIIYFVLACGL